MDLFIIFGYYFARFAQIKMGRFALLWISGLSTRLLCGALLFLLYVAVNERQAWRIKWFVFINENRKNKIAIFSVYENIKFPIEDFL